jgi:hypothetical protein
MMLLFWLLAIGVAAPFVAAALALLIMYPMRRITK